MNDKRAKEIIKIFKEAGIIIELGAHFSVKGQVAQLLNGCEKLKASQPDVEADAKCSVDFHKEEYLNGSTFCRVCGARIRTA